jgi:hypothetical protein
MKTFNNFRKLSLFIVWVLVALLAGVGTTIYADEDSNQGKKEEKEIKLESGIVGKLYNYQFYTIKTAKDTAWKIEECEKAKLPEGLTFSTDGILEGKPKKEGKYTFKVIAPDSNEVELNVDIKPFAQSENLRLITGYEISRASSTIGNEKGFLDAYLSQPLPFLINKKRGLRIWGNIRFTSMPIQNTNTIGALSVDYFSTLSGLKLNEMTQSAEFLLGIESNIFSIKASTEGEYNYALGFIAAYGGSTPLASEKNPNLVIFDMPTSDAQKNNLKELYPKEDFTGIEYISFTPEDRNRFYHQLYFGIRLKAYTDDTGISDLPAMFDATYGFNDAASGGKGRLFKKSVVRFDLFLPIKILDIPIYIFGNVFINTSKETIRKPLVLGEPITGDNKPPVDSDKLLILTEPANDRDYFKIGIGIDLFKIFKSGQAKAEEDKKKAEEAEKKLEKEKVKREELKELRKLIEKHVEKKSTEETENGTIK